MVSFTYLFKIYIYIFLAFLCFIFFFKDTEKIAFTHDQEKRIFASICVLFSFLKNNHVYQNKSDRKSWEPYDFTYMWDI